jgi:hypothetical protein
MKLYLHDASPVGPGGEHGLDGPTHAATVAVDEAYQLEMWIEDVERDQPSIVFAYCPALKRAWERPSGAAKFKEVPWLGVLPPWVDMPDHGDGAERTAERVARAAGWEP